MGRRVRGGIGESVGGGGGEGEEKQHGRASDVRAAGRFRCPSWKCGPIMLKGV